MTKEKYIMLGVIFCENKEENKLEKCLTIMFQTEIKIPKNIQF